YNARPRFVAAFAFAEPEDMPMLRFALAQYDFPVGALAANAARMRALANEARTKDASLIAFPEQSLCGYPAEDLLLRPGFLAGCENELHTLANDIDGIAAVVGHPDSRGEVYNAASVIADGGIVATYHKQALPNYTVFDEKRWFRPGDEALVFTCEGVRTGLLVCEDIWEAEPAAKAAAAGDARGAAATTRARERPADRLCQCDRRTGRPVVRWRLAAGGGEWRGGRARAGFRGTFAVRGIRQRGRYVVRDRLARARRRMRGSDRLCRAGARRAPLRRQERFTRRAAWTFGRDRFRADAGDRGGRAGRRTRHRGDAAVALHLGIVLARSRRPGA